MTYNHQTFYSHDFEKIKTWILDDIENCQTSFTRKIDITFDDERQIMTYSHYAHPSGYRFWHGQILGQYRISKASEVPNV
jgi:hypothetical protein